MLRWFFAAALLASSCTTAEIASAPSEEGVRAYRDKDYETAWGMLAPLAAKGHYRAQRYQAFMLLEGNAPIECGPEGCERQAVALLLDGARRGDNNSLIVLEAMRASDASYAPTDADLLAIELERAGTGDPMTAWRLVKRYQTGAGVEQSAEQALRWLKVTAAGDPTTYSYAPEAAFQVCQAYVTGDGIEENISVGRRWCKKAANQGHNGAVIALSQLDRARRQR
ncbi:MAG: hypothetical protein AAGJ73_15685 [Pseudomonadota bacterium]